MKDDIKNEFNVPYSKYWIPCTCVDTYFLFKYKTHNPCFLHVFLHYQTTNTGLVHVYSIIRIPNIGTELCYFFSKIIDWANRVRKYSNCEAQVSILIYSGMLTFVKWRNHFLVNCIEGATKEFTIRRISLHW